VLTKGEMLADFSRLTLVRRAGKEAREGEVRISARGYHGIQDFGINFYLKVFFPEVLPQAEKLFEII
jgi:hypothetical protein